MSGLLQQQYRPTVRLPSITCRQVATGLLLGRRLDAPLKLTARKLNLGLVRMLLTINCPSRFRQSRIKNGE